MNRSDAFNQLYAYLLVLKDQYQKEMKHVTTQHISTFLDQYDHDSVNIKRLYADFEEWLMYVS